MRRLRILIAVLAVIASVASAGEKSIIVYSHWTSPKDCHVRNAIDVSFRDLVDHPDTYHGKCVAVRGHLGRRALFDTLEDYYAIDGSPWGDDERKIRLGLYGDDQTMAALSRAHRFDVKIIGQAGSCNDLSGPGVVMVLGYCHYTGGPVVFMSDFTAVSGAPRRLTTAEVAADASGFRPVAMGEPTYTKIRNVAGRWLEAVRRSDVNAYLALHDSVSIEARYDPNAVLNQMLFTQRERFGLITQGTVPPPFMAFEILKEPDQPNPGFEGYGCFCKTSDCSGQWPAHRADAIAKPQWPYACFNVAIDPDGATRVNTWQ